MFDRDVHWIRNNYKKPIQKTMCQWKLSWQVATENTILYLEGSKTATATEKITVNSLFNLRAVRLHGHVYLIAVAPCQKISTNFDSLLIFSLAYLMWIYRCIVNKITKKELKQWRNWFENRQHKRWPIRCDMSYAHENASHWCCLNQLLELCFRPD